MLLSFFVVEPMECTLASFPNLLQRTVCSIQSLTLTPAITEDDSARGLHYRHFEEVNTTLLPPRHSVTRVTRVTRVTHTNLEDPKGCGCVMKHLLFFLADTTMFSWHDPLTFCTTSQEVKSRNVMRGTFAQFLMAKATKAACAAACLFLASAEQFSPVRSGPHGSWSLSSLGVN